MVCSFVFVVVVFLSYHLCLCGSFVCLFGGFPYRPLPHEWYIICSDICCRACGKVHIKDFLIRIPLYGGKGCYFSSK